MSGPDLQQEDERQWERLKLALLNAACVLLAIVLVSWEWLTVP